MKRPLVIILVMRSAARLDPAESNLDHDGGPPLCDSRGASRPCQNPGAFLLTQPPRKQYDLVALVEGGAGRGRDRLFFDPALVLACQKYMESRQTNQKRRKKT